MEGLIVVIFVVWAIISSISKTQKAAQKTNKAPNAEGAERKPRSAPGAAPVSLDTFSAPKKKASSPAPRPKAAMEGSLGQYTPMQSREGMSDYKPLTHRLDTTARRTEYTGSLGGGSSEGEDACEPSLGHDRESPPISAGAFGYEAGGQSGFNLSFDKAALLKGVVMSEILTRPAQRKWGRR